jgi:hypothetical protein
LERGMLRQAQHAQQDGALRQAQGDKL